MSRAILNFIFIILIFFINPECSETFVWTTTEPEYQPVEPCGSPLPPNNGTVTVWGNNLLVEYSCDKGLFPVGRIFGSCNPSTKKWTIRRPLCVSSACDKPESLKNGKLYFEQEGSIVVATCKRGFRLTGNRERYCDGYTWRRFRPRCIDRYPSREPRQQNDSDATTAAPQGVAHHFLEEHILDSDSTCYTDFSDPPVVTNATVQIVYRFNKVRREWILIANYTCERGFSFNDTKATYLYCKHYNWVGPRLPVCVNTELPPADPCKTSNGGCAHICIPHKNGRFHCECRLGYALDRFRKKCIDIDECRLDNGGCEHTCINIIGSFFCTCEKGYVSTGRKCLDLDECRTPGAHRCKGECINIPGSFECNCTEDGYTESSDKKSCVDFDECHKDNGGCQEECINTIGSYHCSCFKKGFTISLDGHTCVDVDECTDLKKTRCIHGVCENTHGSFVCHCNTGFVGSSNGRRCLDRNECKLNNGGCAEICINKVGSSSCGCFDDGYVIGNDGKTCFDINECENENGNCEDVCLNTPGSYKCNCSQEFHVLHEDGYSCTTCDRHHFYDKQSRKCIRCPDNKAVNKLVELATKLDDCICESGFTSSNDSSGNCIDLDECDEGQLFCDHICINTPGSAYCECKQGYNLSLDNKCIDIDECSTEPCSQLCENIPGSYKCSCIDGYDLAFDKYSCIDVEECLDQILICDQLCVNIEGGAYCSCEKGYEISEDNVTCKDIDECRATNLCEDECINTQGSYECDCVLPGLKLSWDLASCSDINECMEGDNNCTGVCINTIGSYTCDCYEKGFITSKDGTTCEDQDECTSQDLNDCVETCVNTHGSYRCDCFLGHALIGYNKCAPCPRNYYRDDESVECVSCPHHSVTVMEGSTSVEHCICEEGFHGNLTLGEECVKNSE